LATPSFRASAHSSTKKHTHFATLGLHRTRWNLLSNYLSSLIYTTFPANASGCSSVPGFSILEQTVAKMYSDPPDGLIVGLGYHWADVSTACDGFSLTRARALDNK